MKTTQKGSITELEVQLLLVKDGYDVFTPVTEGCKVDLVFIDENFMPKKVQVKKSIETKYGFQIDLRYSLNSNRAGKGFYTEEQIDFFATTFKGILYLLPIKEMLGKRSYYKNLVV